MGKNVLIIEDDSVTSRIIQTILNQKGYNTTSAENGSIGIEKMNRENFPVVITDIHMPVMGGIEFIEYIHKSNLDPVVLVESGEEDVETVIKVMKLGVYDYLIKPIQRHDLLQKIDKAFELAEMKNLSKNLKKEMEIIHNRKVDWAAWKDALLRKKMEKIDQNLLYNLTTSLSQGAGFGGLVSLIKVIPMQAKEKDNYFLIPKDIIQLIIENANTAGKILDDFSEIGRVINSPFELEEKTIKDIDQLVDETIHESDKHLQLKNQQVKKSHPTEKIDHFKIMIHPKNFKKSIFEMLVNAMKFSERSSEIIVITEPKENFYSVSVISEPTKKGVPIYGIPKEYEKKVFGPFYRLNKTVHEDYPTLDFGIGLTMIQSIIESHKGKVFVRNIDNYTSMQDEKETRVSCEIMIPMN